MQSDKTVSAHSATSGRLDRLEVVFMLTWISLLAWWSADARAPDPPSAWAILAFKVVGSSIGLNLLVWIFRPSGEELPEDLSPASRWLIGCEVLLTIAMVWVTASILAWNLGAPATDLLEHVRSATPLAAWILTAWCVVRLGRVYSNCIEVYWDLVWSCPLLTVEVLFLFGLAFGFVLPDYGVTTLFWGAAAGLESFTIPFMSSIALIFTLAVLFLCSYFKVTHRYDPALDSDPFEGFDLVIASSRADGKRRERPRRTIVVGASRKGLIRIRVYNARRQLKADVSIAPPTSPDPVTIAGVAPTNDQASAVASLRQQLARPGIKSALIHHDDRRRILEEVAIILGRSRRMNARIQARLRTTDLWDRLLPGRDVDTIDANRRNKYPGHYVWICVRPLIFASALPALLPNLGVVSRPGPLARLSWILGLAATTWALRFLLTQVRVVKWLVDHTQPMAEPTRRVAATYPMGLNGSSLWLSIAPILCVGLGIHTVNHAVDGMMSGGHSFPISLGLLGMLSLGTYVIARRHRWSWNEWRPYLRRFVMVASAPVLAALALGLTHGAYVVPSLSICWLLMALSLGSTLLTAFFSGRILNVTTEGDEWRSRIADVLGARGVRRGVQVASIVALLMLVYLNGRHRSDGDSKRLQAFEAWSARYARDRGLGLEPKTTLEFGSPQLNAARDEEVLRLWSKASPTPDSDEPMRIGSWRRSANNFASADWEVDDREKPKLVVVAASGGGLRAGVWAQKVLYELAKEIPEFPDRVRIITGSSGGMLGAACFVTDIDPAAAENQRPRIERLFRPEGSDVDALVRKDLGPHKDFLARVLQGMIFRDLYSPFFLRDRVNRGEVLRRTLRNKDEGIKRLTTTFQDLYMKGEAAGKLPSLVFTPTVVEDSRRMLIANIDLEPLLLNNGSFDPVGEHEIYTLGKDFPSYSRSGVQYFHCFPNEHFGARPLDLASAVVMSAAFPYVTPAHALPLDPNRRVVDAGYYDNHGIDIATAWLEQHRRRLELNTSGVVLIQIRAFSNEDQLKQLTRGSNLDSSEDSPMENLARGTEFLTTPLAAVGAARSNVNYYRNDEAVEHLKRAFTFGMLERLTGIPPRPDPSDYTDEEKSSLEASMPRANSFFRVLTFTCVSDDRARANDKVANRETLSWRLDDAEFDDILGNWRSFDNFRRLQYLRGTFRRRLEVDDEAGDHATGATTRSSIPDDSALTMKVDMDTIKAEKAGEDSDRTHAGKAFTMWNETEADAGKTRFDWVFREVPAGRYRLSVNLPLYVHASSQLLPSEAIADAFRYELRLGNSTLPGIRTLEHTDKWRKGGLGDADEALARIPNLKPDKMTGHWWNVGEPFEVSDPKGKAKKIDVSIRLLGESGRWVVADSVRLDRIDIPVTRPEPQEPSPPLAAAAR